MYRIYETATGRGLHHDAPLTNLAIAAFGVGPYIASQVFPPITVDKQSNRYYIFDPEPFLRIPFTNRAPGTAPRRVQFTVSSDAYFAKNYALATEIPFEDLSNADAAISLRESSARLVTGLLATDFEVRVANLVTSGANLGSYVALSGAAKWSDYVGSDPIADVTTAHAFIRGQTGLVANTLILDTDTLATLRRHPLLLDAFKFTQGGLLGVDNLRALFNVETILVGQGIKENSIEGGTASKTNIWGNTAILARIQAGASVQAQTFGLSFRWQPDGVPAAFQVERYPASDPGQKAEVVAAGYYQDEKIVARNLSYGITTTL